MPESRQASSLSIHCCDHGTVFIHLLDEQGEVIATASMGLAVAVDVLEDLNEATKKALAISLSAQNGDAPQAVH